MPLDLPFPPDRLRQSAAEIIKKVNRAGLQEALLTSKLVRKDISRDELKRFCSNESVWLKFVFDKLSSPSTREAALRSLSALVDASLTNLDTRVVTRMRKARTAAEQSDSEKLIREIESIKSLVVESDEEAFTDPIATLYLWFKAQHARDQLIGCIVVASENNLPAADLTQVEPSRPRAGTASSNALSPEELGSLLVKETVFEPVQGPAWAVTDIVNQIDRPPRTLSIGDLKQLQQTVHSTSTAVRKVALAGAAQRIGIRELGQLRKWSMELQSIGTAAQGIQVDLDALTSRVRSDVHGISDRIEPSIKQQLDQTLSSQNIEDELQTLETLLAENRRLFDERLNRTKQLAEELITLSRELPNSVTVDWDEVETQLRNGGEPYFASQLEETRGILARQKNTKASVEVALKSALDLLKTALRSIESEEVNACRKAVSAGDVDAVRRALSSATIPIVATSVIATETGVPIGDSSHIPPFPKINSPEQSAVLPITWKQVPRNFRPRNRFSTATAPSDANALIEFLKSEAIDHLKRGSTTSVVDCVLDILLLLGEAESGAEIWLKRAITILAVLPIPPSSTAQVRRRATTVFLDTLNKNPDQALTVALEELLQTPGFDESIAQLFVYREFQPFAMTVAHLLHKTAIGHSQYLLEDLARGIGKGALYGYGPTSVDLLGRLAMTSGLKSEVVSDVTAALHLVAENSDRSRVAAKTRVFGAPYWLQEGILAYEGAVPMRGRSVARVVEDKAQKFINVQVPPVIQNSPGFAFTPGSGILEIVLMVTNPPDGGRIASIIELVIPKSRNLWLQHDSTYNVGPLSPADKALVPLTLEVVEPLSDKCELHYEIRVRQAGFLGTGIDAGSLTLTISPPRDVLIDGYKGALGLPILLDEKALDLSSASVRKALRDLQLALSSDGVAALVYGRRRRGKTSILRTIGENADILRKYVVHTDSKEDRPFRTLGEALRHLGNVLDTAMTKAAVQVSSLSELLTVRPQWAVIQEWLEQTKAVIKKPIHLLLLIDEFQKWLSHLDPDSRAQLLGIIRGIYIRQGGNVRISIILSGLTNIYEYRKASADFSNAFHNVYEIQQFDQRASEALIRSNTTIEFDRRAVELIRQLSGGNPYLINLLGNEISKYLRDKHRPYCFRDDVEEVVRGQLDEAQSSPIWLFLQYLLKQGEEDQASEIRELPALTDLAWTLGRRGSARDKVALIEIEGELQRAGVPFDAHVLTDQLEQATANELLVKEGDRYRFESPWLSEWLAISNGGNPVPIESKTDPNLVLNRYRTIERFSHWGQAEVWKAVDIHKIHGTVILKIYPSSWDGSSGVVQREAEHLSRIRHPGVVACLNRGRDEQRGDVIVLEYVDGENLRDLLRSGSNHAAKLIGPNGDLTTQVEFLEQIIAGLAACHAANIVHKDIKPANIVAQSSAGRWFPKIIDFGISTELDNDSSAPTLGPFTAAYTAPEKFLNKPRKSPADIYSVGLVAYELITGVAPFDDDQPDVLKKRLSGDFVPVKVRRPDVPVRLSELVGQMLAVAPVDRPTADTLTGELSRARQEQDWYSYRAEALNSKDPDFIYEKSVAAVLTAPEADRHTTDYRELLDLLVDKAHECKRTVECARQLVQPLLRATLREQGSCQLLAGFVANLLLEPVVDANDRENKRIALKFLIDHLLENTANSSLLPVLEVLLGNQSDAAIWDMRHEVYSAAVNYTVSNLLHGRTEAWCVAACRKVKPLESGVLEAQMWLRRAERLSVTKGADYLSEKAALEKILQSQASSLSLPENAAQQDDKVVGEDERGHLNMDRIDAWVRRLLNLYPFVQSVKRVRKEPDKVGATRMISTEGMSLHLKAAPGIKECRIIPVLLDRSFCGPADTMLRINIVLSESCTPAQREAAMDLLARDRSLFAGGRSDS
jgi:hypothetical protein